jgi:hypothetical protein
MLAQLQEYRSALRAYSEPVRIAAGALADVPFTLEATEQFTFGGFERVAPLYQYPVLTDQIAYLEKTIKQSIDEKLLEESRFLMSCDNARAQISERLNLPAHRLDLLVQLIRQNGGTLSATKRGSHFGDLTDEAIVEAERAVQAAFKQGTAAAIA